MDIYNNKEIEKVKKICRNPCFCLNLENLNAQEKFVFDIELI